jgi:hypothetical protein
MGDPPVEGTVQDIVAVRLPPTAVTFVGVPGTVIPLVGVTWIGFEAKLLSTEFTERKRIV